MSLLIYLLMKVEAGSDKPYDAEMFARSVTHNLIPMWKKAGIYDALYNSNGKTAGDILEAVKAGLQDMNAKPEEYKLLNAEDGFGNYFGAVHFLFDLVKACEYYPKATIGVWK